MSIYICDYCYGVRKNVLGSLTCTKCGIQENTYFLPVMELSSLLNRNKRKKSVHKRNKWFMKRVRGVVGSMMVEMLTQDFIKVVGVLVEEVLIKKNVSRYNYYILRLCSRGNIPFSKGNDREKLVKKITDMKEGKTKRKFDNNLFGIIYKKLGWSKNAKRNCKYYKKWHQQYSSTD